MKKEYIDVVSYDGEGYKPLVVDGINKVVKGFTTLEELNKISLLVKNITFIHYKNYKTKKKIMKKILNKEL